MTIGLRIKELRVQHGVTQSELAEAIGTIKQTIHKYESGVITNIPSDKIESIANYFNVTPAYLMGWNTKDGNRVSNNVSLSEAIKNSYGDRSIDLLDNYIVLNELGQKKALETVSDLTQIPKYQKQPETKNIRLNKQTDDNEITLTVAARGGGVTTVKTTKEALDELTSLEPEDDIDL